MAGAQAALSVALGAGALADSRPRDSTEAEMARRKTTASQTATGGLLGRGDRRRRPTESMRTQTPRDFSRQAQTRAVKRCSFVRHTDEQTRKACWPEWHLMCMALFGMALAPLRFIFPVLFQLVALILQRWKYASMRRLSQPAEISHVHTNSSM